MAGCCGDHNVNPYYRGNGGLATANRKSKNIISVWNNSHANLDSIKQQIQILIDFESKGNLDGAKLYGQTVLSFEEINELLIEMGATYQFSESDIV